MLDINDFLKVHACTAELCICARVPAIIMITALGKKAIMQRDSIEHEQIIYESSNRRMKQLMDWLSNSY